MPYRKYQTPYQPNIFFLALHQAHFHFVCWLRRHLPTWKWWFFRWLAVRIPEGARRKHTYISGSSGSGKSELLKVLVYAQRRKRRPGTTIVLDPNGDMAGEIARWKGNRGGDHCVIVDLSLQHGYSPVINPLQVDDRSPENIDLMSQLFVSAFNEIMDNSQLTLNMKVLLHPCVSILMELGDCSLPDLQHFLDEERCSSLLQRARPCHTFLKHKEFFEYEFMQPDFRPTKRAICKKIQSLLNYQAFYNLTVGSSTVDLKTLLDSRKLVVFNLSKGRLGLEAMPAFGKFLVAMIQGLALRRAAVPEHARVPTHLFLDECHNFLTPAIEEILKESRKYALHLTLTQQTVGDKMRPELFNTVMTNTEVKITGFNDRKCLEVLAEKTYAAPEQLYRLFLGRFAVKVGKGLYPPTFILRSPGFLLGQAHAMGAGEWEDLKTKQLFAYYKPVRLWDDRPPVAASGTDPGEFVPTAVPATAGLWRLPSKLLPLTPKYRF